VRQQPEPSLLSKQGLRPAEEIHAAHGVADGMGGHAEQAQHVAIVDVLRDEPRQQVHDRGALQDGLGHRERRDVARVIGGIGERPGRPNPSAAIMAPAKRR